MEIVWTKHAEYRQKEWEKKKGITKEDVESVVGLPGQIVRGDLDALVAQSRFKGGLIRIPFLEMDGTRKILTVEGVALMLKANISTLVLFMVRISFLLNLNGNRPCKHSLMSRHPITSERWLSDYYFFAKEPQYLYHQYMAGGAV